MSRLSTVRATLKMARERDPRFVAYVLLALLGTVGVVFGIGVLLGSPVLFFVLSLPLGLVAGMIVAGRRVSAAAYAGIEGQPGAAAAILGSMRGQWHVTPAVAMTRSQDFVHRVVGRPGVVLVAEGSGGRPRELIGTEARKLRRVIGETPLYDVVVGDGEGQVPLKRLQIHVMKLPRNLKPRQVNELEAKLKAMSPTAMPIPKGPIPKNLKPPRGRR